MHPREVKEHLKNLLYQRREIAKRIQAVKEACSHSGTTQARVNGLFWCGACKRYFPGATNAS